MFLEELLKKKYLKMTKILSDYQKLVIRWSLTRLNQNTTIENSFISYRVDQYYNKVE